jgi:DNA-binding MarR family transcriptional regulator
MEWQMPADPEHSRADTQWLPLEAPESQVNHWLKLARVRFSTNLTQILEPSRLIASEWTVLRELYRPGRRSVVELGQAMGMSRAGISKLINRLVKKGYVAKEVQELDRRFRGVWLTDYGRECVPLIASKEKSMDREFFGPLKNGGRYRLKESLKRTLTLSRIRHMENWLSLHGILNLPQPYGDSTASDARSKWEAAEAFWKHCEAVALAAAMRGWGPEPAKATPVAEAAIE